MEANEQPVTPVVVQNVDESIFSRESSTRE
jgi:hypothetical protein